MFQPRSLLRLEAVFALIMLIGAFYLLNSIVPNYYALASDRVKVLFLSQLGSEPIAMGWLAIIAVLIAPDLALAGAALSHNRQSMSLVIYNAAHSYAIVAFLVFPLLVLVYSRGETTLLGGVYYATRVILLWFIHIAVDRIFTYGLRTGWRRSDTHLSTRYDRLE